MFRSPDVFLARRYLRPRRSLTSIITLLSVVGPALGVTVLIVTTAVFSGFDREIKQRLLGMQAHVHVYPQPAGWREEQPIISEPAPIFEIMETVGLAAAPSIDDLVILQFRESMEIKSMSGILPEREALITDLPASMVQGGYAIAPGEILVGSPLALQLGLRIGDRLLVHAPRRLARHLEWSEGGGIEARESDVVHLPEEVVVAGIFSFGIHQLDQNVVYMHIDQAAELLGLDWEVATAIRGRLADPFHLEQELAELRRQLPGFRVVTWQEQNERLLGAIQVEKNLTLFLLFFIVLVAAFSIAGTLITSVIQKTREIGILKALGLSPLAIARVFVYQGAIIGLVGTLSGCLAGFLIVRHRNLVADLIARLLGREIFPPELYYLDSIPAWLTAREMINIGVLAFVVCVFASLLPALYASCLQPARALTEE